MNEIFPCMISSVFFLTLFGFLALMRYLRYKETTVLAEKGLVRPGPYGNGKDTLRWGIAITAVGLALCIGLFPIGFLPGNRTDFPFGFGPWMLGGLIPTFFGLGLVLIYILTRDGKSKNDKDEPPPPPPAA